MTHRRARSPSLSWSTCLPSTEALNYTGRGEPAIVDIHSPLARTMGLAEYVLGELACLRRDSSACVSAISRFLSETTAHTIPQTRGRCVTPSLYRDQNPVRPSDLGTPSAPELCPRLEREWKSAGARRCRERHTATCPYSPTVAHATTPPESCSTLSRGNPRTGERILLAGTAFLLHCPETGLGAIRARSWLSDQTPPRGARVRHGHGAATRLAGPGPRYHSRHGSAQGS